MEIYILMVLVSAIAALSHRNAKQQVPERKS